MQFQVPTKLVFGSGTIGSIKQIVETDLNASRLFLVTDKGIVESGLADTVRSRVDVIGTFDGVEPNPKSSTVNNAAERIREQQPDAIIGLGGGSALDAAKAIALLATNGGTIEDYEGREKYRKPPLPLVAIPTTCGTASEVTWVSVITDEKRKFKMSIKGQHMFPAIAIVDPDLLLSLPKSLIAGTGLDALTHAIEAYTVKPANLVTDMFALKSIALVSGSLERAYRDIEGDATARENLMYGSTLAGFAFGNSDVGAVHCISESIGALFDIPHGVANAVFLPHVMKFNLPASWDRYADVAEAMGIGEEDRQVAAGRSIETVEALCRSLEIPVFNQLGIDETQFPTIARYAVQNNSNSSNPREATAGDYLDMLHKAASDAKHK